MRTGLGRRCSGAPRKLQEMDISFHCQNCRQHILTDDSMTGRLMNCPNCGQRVVVVGPMPAAPPHLPPHPEPKPPNPAPSFSPPPAPAPAPVPVPAAKQLVVAPASPAPHSKLQPSSAPLSVDQIEREISTLAPEAPVKSYVVLRAISLVFKVFAVMFAIIGVATAVAIKLRVQQEPWNSLWVAAIALGGLIFIFSWACSELIMLFIDLEEHARATREVLERLES